VLPLLLYSVVTCNSYDGTSSTISPTKMDGANLALGTFGVVAFVSSPCV